MLCHLFLFVSLLLLSVLGNPLITTFQTISPDIDISDSNRTKDYNQTEITAETNNHFVYLNASNAAKNETYDEILSASSAQQLTWVKSTDGKYVSVKNDPNNTNSSHSMKNMLKVFKNADKREDPDLGLPPDIANEYID